MDIERSLSQVNKEDLEPSDFSRVVCGEGDYQFSTFQKVSQRAVQSKMIFPIAMSWIKADFSRGNKIFFSLSFCSISSIWHPSLLVSPSNMWKMYSTMQSRWLGPHLLSHCSLHYCRCLLKTETNSVRSHWKGATEKWKNVLAYATTQIFCGLSPTDNFLGIGCSQEP